MLISLVPAGPVLAQLEEQTAARIVRQRLRIVPRGAGPDDVCARIGVEDLRVRLRGETVPIERLVELERPRGPRVHALLVDTSGSMVGDIEAARRAATRYLELLDPARDRVAVLSFADDVLLAHALDGDFDATRRAIARLRMGGNTSLLDAVHDAITLFDGEPARPVVVVLTDGLDSNSLYENREVLERVGRREDLVVFTIGLKLPPINAGRRSVAAQKLLTQLSGRSHGRFFEIHRGRKIEQSFAEVLTLLDQEAVLSLVDDLPEADPGKVTVRSRDRRCRVVVLERLGAPRRPEPAPASGAIPVLPGSAIEGLRRHKPHLMWKGGCAPDEATAGRLDVAERRLEGCLLDLALAGGGLHDPWDGRRLVDDIEPTTLWREVRSEVPALARLPASPVALLERVAIEAQALPAKPPRTHPRKRPPHRFARPFVDHPLLVDGRTLIESRAELAAALYRVEDYAALADRRLARQTRAIHAQEVERLSRLRPDLARERVRELAGMSRAVARSKSIERAPRPEELAPHLGAWLGDLPVADLFIEWERQQVTRALRGEIDEAEARLFVERWRAAHRLLGLASYARVLGVVAPAYDPQEDRVGFYRFVLPRPSWYLPRMRDHRRHPEWKDLPLDLVPPHPAALATLIRLADDPDWLRRFAASGRERPGYRLIGSAKRLSPERAFSAMAIEWHGAGVTAATALFRDDVPYESEAAIERLRRELLDPSPESESTEVLPLCLARWPEPCLTEAGP